MASEAIATMATGIGHVLGYHEGVDLHWDADTKVWTCTAAAPRVWFAAPFLDVIGPICTVLGVWRRDGTYVRLSASNGTWLWRLTDNTTEPTAGMVFREGVWPD